MKSLLALLIFASFVFPQESQKLIAYGNIGFGLSGGAYQTSRGGTVSRLGATVGYSYFLVKVDRTVNNEVITLAPPEKAASYSYLFGVSFHPFQNLPELLLNGKYGFGKGELTKRGDVIEYKPFDNKYALIIEKYSTNILEIDLEFRFRNVGFYLGGFSESIPSKRIYGATLGAIFGYF